MADIKRYWALVAEQRARLLAQHGVKVEHLQPAQITHLASGDAPAIWITSIEDPMTGQIGDRTSAVSVEIAARRIVERSHRLSSKEEIERFRAEQKEREAHCAEVEFRRKQEKGGVNVLLSQEDAEQMGAIPPRAKGRKEAA